jgi:aminoglycoside phosphotransferase (APT) family kinase protein
VAAGPAFVYLTGRPMRAPIPDSEAARLEALRSHELVGSAPERPFDDIVELARFVCDMPMALVTLVEEDRQWFKARVGITIVESSRDSSICAHALSRQDALVVPDTHEDPRFSDNPLVTGDPSIRFYAGVPIHVDGAEAAVGTLCVLDRVPRTLNAKQLDALAALGRRVETEMSLRKKALDSRRLNTPAPPSRGPASRDSEVAVGDLITGRYRIEHLIGAGGMGRIYQAFDLHEDRRVALKVMAGMAISDQEALERFTREAKALLRLRSPHVARCVDVGNLRDGSPFIVLEHLEGRDLSERQATALALEEAIDLAVQACEGIAAAHEAGIVHRDLKPANLFLVKHDDGTSTLKVLDFGIAKLLEDEVDPAGDAAPAITQPADTLGSPRYMSPEQLLSSRDVDASTDLWAIGVVVYELLTGAHPFDGTSAMEICANIFTKKARSMREHHPELSAALDEVVLRCLAREKSDRWPSARALADALSPFR